MVTKKIIDKDFRILNKSCNSLTSPQISDDDVETLHLEKGSETRQKSAPESIDNLETTPLAVLQNTPNLSNSIAKFSAIEANLMAIKSYFMDEVYELRNEVSETIASPNAKMRDPQEKENRNKNSRRHIFKIGDSMVKHINGPGISKNDQVQVKTHPGATTDDIIDYIKPSIRQKPDIVIVHSGTNDLTKDVSTMNRVPKVVAAVK